MPTARPIPGPAPTADPAFAALKSRLVARTGHHYYADKDDLLWERVGRRMRVRGVPDPAGYLALLGESAAEWAALESEITMTTFLRFISRGLLLWLALCAPLAVRAGGDHDHDHGQAGPGAAQPGHDPMLQVASPGRPAPTLRPALKQTTARRTDPAP